MAGFRRILCASDLSEAADWAIRAADGEARWHGAELVVLHVMPVTYPGAPMSPESMEQTVVRQEQLASDVIDVLLERVERLTGRDAGQVSVMVEDGAPDETIVRQSDLAADEAVRRCTGITVVHSLELFSPELAMGEPVALPPIAFGAYPIAEMREAAHKRLAATLVHLGIAGEIAVTEGPPSEAIVRLAAEKHVDLVVIGTSGRKGIDRILLGSVAAKVVREAPCSVLVARSASQPRRRTGAEHLTSAAG